MFRLLSVLLLVPLLLAADPDSPHPHQGKLEAYSGAPPQPELSAQDRVRLDAGEVIKKQTRTATGGRGMAIRYVHAPPEVVWSCILDFEDYPRMVDNVKEAQILSVEGEHRIVHFVLGAMMVSVEYWIDHIYRPEQGYMTWTLDYSRESDLDDTVGFWRVEPVPHREGWSRVTYSVALQVRGWVPDFIEEMVTDSGLTKATVWVQRESEKKAGTAEPEEE